MKIDFPYPGYERIAAIKVSVTREETERLGFRYAATAQDALEMAFKRQGREAKVALLRHGGHILPLIENETAEIGVR